MKLELLGAGLNNLKHPANLLVQRLEEIGQALIGRPTAVSARKVFNMTVAAAGTGSFFDYTWGIHR